MDSSRLIEIQNAISTQYFCSECDEMLIEVQNDIIKKFESCEHFHIEKMPKDFCFLQYTRRSKFKAEFIAKDKYYYYQLVPNLTNQ